ncbi:enoyl-CoA hydratase/carnithine racemase [Amycolatopsis bartoniae]|uniref:Carnitinyl-CoA dehydratase n=1 Tax=Amycolatopsis bartoniae TaxID=941986 RepID=A0A8H9IW95_9PSEU|nr:enoyl-CoA hydratase-related protein [Amycolatopsis bartoniae]MBB2935653.1 enoyl-CoA hydratase/carnithine racemase [Amycolatopsis bartoniae]TVT02332.1 enoyl-CoA hydratase [Amycolatopsis bartoniae]GHF60876.1 carnitinyl-CoA dehydratase [Amycolatopsis bartoniae]
MSVRQEVRDRILVVHIEREAKRNAIDVETALGIDAALNRLDDDPELWVGVLTGTRTVFSAGTDLKDGLDFRTERGGEYGVIRRRRVKPLVAAVEGVAFGGGFEIALACDLVVASAGARFALPETLRGLVPTSGALFRVIRALPLHVAKELLITGAELSAEQARQFGFVNRVTEAGQALEGALAVAEEICASSPVAVRAVLDAVAAQLADDDRRGWEETARAMETIRGSADSREGIAAFFERREPRWTGR